MLISNILLTIAVLSALSGVVAGVMITDFLLKRGVKINWMFLRVLILKYVSQYRDLTRSETGRAGRLYNWYVVAMNLALVTAVFGLILRIA